MGNSEQHKESCKYGVELSKHFISLASAGLAFAVGVGLKTPDIDCPRMLIATVILFGFSIATGLAFVMHIIAVINKDGNYDVYTGSVRFVMGLQLLSFLFGVSFVAIVALRTITPRGPSALAPDIVLTMGNKKLEHAIRPHTKIKIQANDSTGFEVQAEPAP